MTYTIEQINEAWIEFCKPVLLVSDKHPEELPTGGIIPKSNINEYHRSDFISFLIDYHNKSKKERNK